MVESSVKHKAAARRTALMTHKQSDDGDDATQWRTIFKRCVDGDFEIEQVRCTQHAASHWAVRDDVQQVVGFIFLANWSSSSVLLFLIRMRLMCCVCLQQLIPRWLVMVLGGRIALIKGHGECKVDCTKQALERLRLGRGYRRWWFCCSTFWQHLIPTCLTADILARFCALLFTSSTFYIEAFPICNSLLLRPPSPSFSYF